MNVSRPSSQAQWLLTVLERHLAIHSKLEKIGMNEATTLDAISFWTVKLREHHDGHCVCYIVAVTLQLVFNIHCPVEVRAILFHQVSRERVCNNTIIDLYKHEVYTYTEPVQIIVIICC